MSTPTYAQILRRHASQRPDAPALTTGEQTLSFAQLHAGSARVGQALRAEGVQPGDRVAMLAKNCAESFELLFACNMVGAVLAGLNWRLSAREIAAIVTDATPKVLVVAPDGEPLLAELPTKSAVRLAAQISGAPRNALYALALQKKPDASSD